MTLVVAIPFGFAVRDTLHGDDLASKQEREAKEQAAREQQLHDEELAEQQRAYEREKQAKLAATKLRASLIGRTPGALGPVVGAQIGDPAPDGFEQQLVDTGLEYGLQLHGDGRVASVSFTLGEENCGDMREALVTAWGTASDDIWVDAEHHRRASLGGLLCVLHFDQFVDDKAWVKAAMPNLIGKTPAQAAKLLGTPTVPLDEPTLSWYLPGPALGRDSTELRADVDNGTIVDTVTVTTVTAEQARLLIAATAKQLGKQPVQDDYSTDQIWETKHVRASYNEASLLTLAVGPNP
jgi:hypothetical protein